MKPLKKYPLLGDTNWLKQKYEVEKLTTLQIGKLVGGANCGQVSARLKRVGIEARPRISKKYELLNDKEWLIRKYEDEKLSTIEIGKLVGGASCAQVANFLRKCGIRVRTKSEGHTCDREDNDGFILNKSVITGCLLGDGGLKAHNRESDDSYPVFGKSNIYYDHICYVAQLIFGEKWPNRVRERMQIDGFSASKEHPRRIFIFRSLTHKELMPLFRSWYPPHNGFKKVIPENIEVDETVLLHWFLDDGYSCRRKNRDHKVYAAFSTMCFERDEQEMLCEKIKNKFGLRFKVSYHQRYGVVKGTGWEIIVPQSQTPAFFEIIGSCPVNSLQYKWKIDPPRPENIEIKGYTFNGVFIPQHSRTMMHKGPWLATYPEGKQEVIWNLAKFAREHNLCKSSLSSVACGQHKQHKGFKCEKLHKEPYGYSD
jgi:hypothetical protein